MSKVAVIRCESYEQEEVKTAVQRGLDLLGGVEEFAKPGETILFKPNILEGGDPAKCMTTHPMVLEAVVLAFQAVDAEFVFGDSPGVASPKGAARMSGLLKIAQKYGVELADFANGEEISFPEGKLVKKFNIAKGVLEADGLISIPKMKTHALARLTGAVKNTFGVIPGVLKAEFHSRMPTADMFAKMLVDLNLLVKPRLYIMDGIYAMEGNGPRNGTPRTMNVLLLSSDPVALDATAAKLMNLDARKVETIMIGDAWGLGTFSNIEYVGDPVEEFIAEDFDVNRSNLPTTPGLSFLNSGLIKTFFARRPVIEDEKCIRCGRCINICPAVPDKALEWPDGDMTKAPVYDYSKCIRCYCCQEMCPAEAITVETPLLGRLIH
jgi:uncharacterized protein (DUF362 family)/Pyruvate/2-oxoacid:ferredoxin oxidoreductase delta subunit